jgi:hypothetical protein
MSHSVRVYDLLTRTESLPFPEATQVLAANQGEVALLLEPKGWSVCVNGRSSWLFTDAHARAARLWLLADGVWRLSADSGFLDEATAVLRALAQTVAARSKTTSHEALA